MWQSRVASATRVDGVLIDVAGLIPRRRTRFKKASEYKVTRSKISNPDGMEQVLPGRRAVWWWVAGEGQPRDRVAIPVPAKAHSHAQIWLDSNLNKSFDECVFF